MTYTAVTALPHPHLERATAGLRAQLRARLLDAGSTEPPDWTGLEVSGPQELVDSHVRP